jgi:MFS superfamily sulfate permease-like transporter
LKWFAGARPVTSRGVWRDVLAGVNLASINVPQVLGYARIAGMPIVTGLYTVLLPLLAFAVFGSSRHLIVAADSATAAILSGSVGHMATPSSAAYVSLVGTVALLTALLLLMARIFRLGFLSDFLSRTVLTGFLTGVGLQVAIAMLGDMSATPVDSRSSPVRLWEVLHGLVVAPHLPTLALSAGVVAALVTSKRFWPRFPLSSITVVGTIAASAAFDLAAHGIATLGPIPGGLPRLALPTPAWSEVLALVPVAGSCFIMIIAQSTATARAFSVLYREPCDSNADILGLAAANAAAAASGAFVVNGSPTQTAMANLVGARSQIASLALCGAVALVLVFLTGALQYLPRCVLASIVFAIGVGMVDLGRLRDIRRESPGEFTLAIVTTATVVVVGVEQGILLAIALSLFRHVRHSYRPHTTMLVPEGQGDWKSIAATPGRETQPGVIVYRFGADLFYANQNRFVDEVHALVAGAPEHVRWFICDAGAITDLDYSAAKALLDLVGELKDRGVHLVFGRVNMYLRADMDRHGITAALGTANVLPTLHAAIALTHAAPAPAPSPA